MAELAEAWANIYSQYIEQNQSAETKYVFQLEWEIVRLNEEIQRIETGLEILRSMVMFEQRDVDIVSTQLRKYGYAYSFDVDNPDGYQADIEHCMNRLSVKRYKMQTREKELEDFNRSRKDNTIDENYFATWIRRLTKYLGFRMRKDETTVEEFIGYTRDYLDEIRAHNREIDNLKNKNRR